MFEPILLNDILIRIKIYNKIWIYAKKGLQFDEKYGMIYKRDCKEYDMRWSERLLTVCQVIFMEYVRFKTGRVRIHKAVCREEQ